MGTLHCTVTQTAKRSHEGAEDSARLVPRRGNPQLLWSQDKAFQPVDDEPAHYGLCATAERKNIRDGSLTAGIACRACHC